MQLDAVQNRIIKGKPSSISLLKGISGTGKTTTAVYKTFYLKNNYCLYNEDKVLILAKDSSNRDSIREMYNKIEDETKFEYMTLFTDNVDKVDIYTVGDIINRYYFEYTNNNKKWFKVVQEDRELENIIEISLKALVMKYGQLKILNKKYLTFFKDEINWIKACGYRDLDKYQTADRIGRRCKKGEGPLRLLKNSKEREIIFELFENYNLRLQENNMIDCMDIIYFAFKELNRSKDNRYAHIIVDEAQHLTKLELDFILALQSDKAYSSSLFVINKSKEGNHASWFIKGRKNNCLELGNTVKNYTLSKVYSSFDEREILMQNTATLKDSMEKFNFIDLRHHRLYEFKRDSSVTSEVILYSGNEEQILKSEELKQLPVYSDIAAGEPIMMNNELEDEFYLPEYWVKGAKDCFILKVKGDSMIGANIFDGDHVVIRKQYTAQKGDIVAVDLDGSATLKRLAYNKNVPVLMPENDNYEPIFMHDKQASILGIAMGVIKRLEN
jgi:SOS regulatory protein LexA